MEKIKLGAIARGHKFSFVDDERAEHAYVVLGYSCHRICAGGDLIEVRRAAYNSADDPFDASSIAIPALTDVYVANSKPLNQSK